LGIISQQLLPARFSEKQFEQAEDPDLPPLDLSGLPALTNEQASALQAMTERDTYLLHGITGSGKTRLYIALAVKAVSEDRSAVILTPEISLTSQLAANFRQVFGRRVIVMHSQQTPAERQAAWLQCLRSKAPVVVVGPRSALFSPVPKPGLIILKYRPLLNTNLEKMVSGHTSRQVHQRHMLSMEK
jgi:primosomal protein N' (replication factor Y)